MKRPRTLEKNERGSALAYVLIFGVIIMILVVGLLAVGQSGIAFTQESVESRQAYIDAKSVIERGKIEISKRVTELEKAEMILYELYVAYDDLVNSEEASETDIRNKLKDISTAEVNRNNKVTELKADFSIFANPKMVSETLDKSSGIEEVGYLEVNAKDTQFDFMIKTKKLRRKLDYKVSFGYEGVSMEENSGEPIRPTDKPYKGGWIKGTIVEESGKVYAKFKGLNKISENNQKKLIIEESFKSLNIEEDFEWVHGRTLDMTAQNIKVTESFPEDGVSSGSKISHFNLTAVGKMASETESKIPGEIRIVDEYKQKNKGLNKMTAEGGNIIFEEGLEIGDKGQLEIKCKNLFIKDEVALKSSGAKLEITADNVIIKEEIELESGAEVNIICRNIWIDKEIKLESANTKLNITADNMFIDGDIELKSGTELNLSSKSSSHVEMKNIITKSSKAKITIEKVNYLKTDDLSLEDKAEVTITGTPGKENNQAIIGSIYPGTEGSVKIGTHALKINITNFDYFICDDLIFDGASTLNLEAKHILIKRAYKQHNSIDAIIRGDLVVFTGEKFELHGNNKDSLSLKIQADDIIIESKMEIKQHWEGINSGFEYSGKGSNFNPTNLYLQGDFTWKPQAQEYIINKGTYNAVSGNLPGVGLGAWLYEKTPTAYAPPAFPPLPPSSGGLGDGGSGTGTGTGSGSGSSGIRKGYIKIYPDTELYK